MDAQNHRPIAGLAQKNRRLSDRWQIHDDVFIIMHRNFYQCNTNALACQLIVLGIP